MAEGAQQGKAMVKPMVRDSFGCSGHSCKIKGKRSDVTAGSQLINMQLGRNGDQEKGLENKMDGQCRGLSPGPGGACDTSDTMTSSGGRISKRADNRGVQRKATQHGRRGVLETRAGSHGKERKRRGFWREMLLFAPSHNTKARWHFTESRPVTQLTFYGAPDKSK
ncbi:nucleolin [Platysternon megacephalum]|uniref:Nucleolin n=1 Tax=Platysternon megacephalum TaxID=55544 RepID=A0A4D9E7Q2_9SAUR|nr:nucleolin [Platysternon megacephalum]